VPPTDCGRLSSGAERYTIKADQLRCPTARRHARTYLRSHRRPHGYRCRDYHGGTAITFRCSRGVRVFFAIRR
jgi:hypothetical protein